MKNRMSSAACPLNAFSCTSVIARTLSMLPAPPTNGIVPTAYSKWREALDTNRLVDVEQRRRSMYDGSCGKQAFLAAYEAIKFPLSQSSFNDATLFNDSICLLKLSFGLTDIEFDRLVKLESKTNECDTTISLFSNRIKNIDNHPFYNILSFPKREDFNAWKRQEMAWTEETLKRIVSWKQRSITQSQDKVSRNVFTCCVSNESNELPTKSFKKSMNVVSDTTVSLTNTASNSRSNDELQERLNSFTSDDALNSCENSDYHRFYVTLLEALLQEENVNMNLGKTKEHFVVGLSNTADYILEEFSMRYGIINRFRDLIILHILVRCFESTVPHLKLVLVYVAKLVLSRQDFLHDSIVNSIKIPFTSTETNTAYEFSATKQEEHLLSSTFGSVITELEHRLSFFHAVVPRNSDGIESIRLSIRLLKIINQSSESIFINILTEYIRSGYTKRFLLLIHRNGKSIIERREWLQPSEIIDLCNATKEDIEKDGLFFEPAFPVNMNYRRVIIETYRDLLEEIALAWMRRKHELSTLDFELETTLRNWWITMKKWCPSINPIYYSPLFRWIDDCSDECKRLVVGSTMLDQVFETIVTMSVRLTDLAKESYFKGQLMRQFSMSSGSDSSPGERFERLDSLVKARNMADHKEDLHLSHDEIMAVLDAKIGIAELNQENQKLQNQLDTCKKALDDALSEKLRRVEETVDKEDYFDEIQHELEKSKSGFQDLRLHRDKLIARVKELEKDIADRDINIRNVELFSKSQLDSLTKENEKLDDQLKRACRELAAARAKLIEVLE